MTNAIFPPFSFTITSKFGANKNQTFKKKNFPLVTPQKPHHFTFKSTPEHRHESSWTFESNVRDDLTTNDHQDATINHPSNVNNICTLELLLAVAGLPAPPPPSCSPTPSSPSSTPSWPSPSPTSPGSPGTTSPTRSMEADCLVVADLGPGLFHLLSFHLRPPTSSGDDNNLLPYWSSPNSVFILIIWSSKYFP